MYFGIEAVYFRLPLFTLDNTLNCCIRLYLLLENLRSCGLSSESPASVIGRGDMALLPMSRRYTGWGNSSAAPSHALVQNLGPSHNVKFHRTTIVSTPTKRMRRPLYWDWVVAAADAGGNAPDASNNPDPYAFASSFYGPGVVFAWYMILLTVTLNIKHDAEHRPNNGLRLSPDLVTLLSYPALAAGHLLVRLADFPPPEHARLFEILLDLFYAVKDGDGANASFFSLPPEDGTVAETPRLVPWVRDASPPSIVAVQHCVGIEGPARVVQNFVLLMLMCVLGTLSCTGRQCLDSSLWTSCWPWGSRRKRRFGIDWVMLLVFAVYFWCCVLLVALVVVGWSARLVQSYIWLMVLGQVCGFQLVFGLLSVGVGWIYLLCSEFLSTSSVWLLLWILAAGPLGFGAFWFWQFLLVFLSGMIVPDTGVSFGELDQVATAVAGAITLAITLFSKTGMGRYIVGKSKTWWRAAKGRVSRGSAEDLLIPLHSTTGGRRGQVGHVHAA